MPIRARLPDGRVIVAPDDTTPEELDALVNEQAEPQESAASRFASGVGRVLDPRPLVGMLKSAVTPRTEGPFSKGVGRLVPPPLITQMEVFGALVGAQGEQAKKAVGRLREGRFNEAAGHGLAAALPVVGPLAARAGERGASGDVAGMLGEATGLLGSLALPKAAAPVGRRITKMGEKFYQGGLKIPESIASKAKGGAKAITQTGLREGIPLSPGGLDKIEDIIGKSNDTVQNALTGRGLHVSPRAAMRPLGATTQKAAQQVTPTGDLRDIGNVAAEFRRVHGQSGPMPAELAQQLKTGTYARLKKDYGKTSTATKEAQKALARGLKEELERVAPEIIPENARISSLIDLKKVLSRPRIGNRDAMGLAELGTLAMNPKALPAAMAMRPYVQGQIGRLLNRTGQATNPAAVQAAILALLSGQQPQEP